MNFKVEKYLESKITLGIFIFQKPKSPYLPNLSLFWIFFLEQELIDEKELLWGVKLEVDA